MIRESFETHSEALISNHISLDSCDSFGLSQAVQSFQNAEHWMKNGARKQTAFVQSSLDSWFIMWDRFLCTHYKADQLEIYEIRFFVWRWNEMASTLFIRVKRALFILTFCWTFHRFHLNPSNPRLVHIFITESHVQYPVFYACKYIHASDRKLLFM